MIHKLQPEDCLKWKNVCEILLAELDNGVNIVWHLMFSDKETFQRGGS
jgi:hypothetical protein